MDVITAKAVTQKSMASRCLEWLKGMWNITKTNNRNIRVVETAAAAYTKRAEEWRLCVQGRRRHREGAPDRTQCDGNHTRDGFRAEDCRPFEVHVVSACLEALVML
jgi:hypothetical protein